jgi:hypothetical protein
VTRARLAAAAVAGALVGAVVTLALPVPGVPSGPADDPGSPVQVLGPAEVPTLLAWTPGGLPQGFTAAVRALPSVRSVAVVRSGIVWLDSWAEAGRPPQSPARGLRIPTEVAAVHPAAYRAFVPASDRPSVAGLARGHALLGSTAAALRDVDAGGSLTMGTERLTVDGVMEDGLVGAHEVVVSYETGRELGVVTPRYLLVAPRPDVDHRKVEVGLRRVVGPGVRLRVRAPGETPVFRQGDAVLPQVRLKELFGEFAAVPQPDGTLRVDPAWTREYIGEARVPILRGAVVCHRLILPQLRAALRELVRKGLGDLIDPSDYGGCYSPRFANFDTGAGLSHHTWGVAIDFNVSRNLLGNQPTLDPRVVEVFREAGFQWGGQFLVPDGMHFEFLEFPD